MASLLATGHPDLRITVLVFGDGPLVPTLRAECPQVDVRARPLPPALARFGEAAGPTALLGTALRAAGSVARFLFELRRELGALEPSVVHCNGIKAHLLGSMASPRGASVVWHLHDFIGSRRLARRLLAAARWRVHGMVANSDAVAQDARRAIPGVPSEVVYNAIDIAAFHPGPRDDELFVGVPGDAVRVGLIGTYARWKGHELFLRAAARLASRYGPSEAAFVIVGGPIYATSGSQYSDEELRAVARSLGVAERITFVPFQESPERTFRSLDVIVHASTRPEPFGRVIVEGMASGRAVVVSAEGGAAELFEEGVDALGFVPRDVDSLADTVARLVDDPELRRRLGERGRETAVGRFGRARLGPELLRAYARFEGR